MPRKNNPGIDLTTWLYGVYYDDKYENEDMVTIPINIDPELTS